MAYQTDYLQRQIDILKKRICCINNTSTGGSSVLLYDTYADLPEIGDATSLYFVRDVGIFYLWVDGEGSGYYETGFDPNALEGLYTDVVFVDTIEDLPLVSDASTSRLYLVKNSGVLYYFTGSEYLEVNTQVSYNSVPFVVQFSSFPTNAHLNNFVDSSAGTLTMSGSELVVGGTASVLTSNTINYPVDFMGENWSMSCTIRATVSGASQVFGLGVKNTTTRAATGTKKELSFSIDISNGANKGLATIFTGANGTFTSRASTAGNLLPINANDIIQLSVSRNGAVIDAVATNVTQGVTRLLTYTYPIQSTSDPILPNMGRPSFFQLSQQDVNVLSFSFVLYPEVAGEKVDLLIHGDSKTEGYNTTSNIDRYTEQVKAAFPTKTITTMAGFGDETADTLKVLPHIIGLKPRIMVFAMGSNDVRNSVTDNTLYNNMLTVYNTCKQHNIKVIFLGMGEAVISQANYWEKARAIFGEENCVFTYPALAGDNVHLTSAGHTTVANALISKLTPIL